mmetsp:Transcript_22962/g.54289  ORF Transcript_22962/g.54289 Transcript_22962/m.54289 type:complete len:266 (+) Transcript_22962:163-960(+)
MRLDHPFDYHVLQNLHFRRLRSSDFFHRPVLDRIRKGAGGSAALLQQARHVLGSQHPNLIVSRLEEVSYDHVAPVLRHRAFRFLPQDELVGFQLEAAHEGVGRPLGPQQAHHLRNRPQLEVQAIAAVASLAQRAIGAGVRYGAALDLVLGSLRERNVKVGDGGGEVEDRESLAVPQGGGGHLELREVVLDGSKRHGQDPSLLQRGPPFGQGREHGGRIDDPPVQPNAAFARGSFAPRRVRRGFRGVRANTAAASFAFSDHRRRIR